MSGNGEDVSIRPRIGLCLALCVGLITASNAARASDCPGHPDALGTSRTIVVDPREHPRIGTMQYRETLPLRDHEVVLTFDDGPLPKYSNQILQILANECIKATFFIIGGQAQANPEGVRKLLAAGHTIGTHSQNHPLTFAKMPIDKAEAEIEQGIASTAAALADPSAIAPFFRIPGLLRADGVEEYLASRGLQVWSADFPADDWRHISPERVHQLAIQRLEAKGKGILLLHDIQPRTVAALPRIIRDLKARGYQIAHVVPATPDRPATPTEPAQWQLHPPSESVPVAQWPPIPNFVFARTDALPVPDLEGLNAELPHSAWSPPPASVRADLFNIATDSLAPLLATVPARQLKTKLASVDHAAASTPAGRNVKGRTKRISISSHGRQPAQGRRAPTRLASLKKR